jgi:hypothetical protein
LRIVSVPETLLVMKRASFLMLTAASLGTISVTHNAAALGPVDIEIAAKVGGGTNPEKNVADLPPNALGLGLGGRAGVSLFGLYGGVSFMDYLGTKGQVYGGTESLKSILYGVEVGYNIGVPLLTLRPQLGVGNYTVSASYSGGVAGLAAAPPPNSGASNLYLEPGVTGLFSFGMLIVGADANVLFLPGMHGSQPAFTAHGQIGIKF